MACGCSSGIGCCGQHKGLGFLSLPESGESDYWGFGDSFWGDSNGGDYWGFNDPFWGGGSNDFWGFDNSYWGGYYDPSSNTFVFPGNDAAFLPANTGTNHGGDFWGFGGDFWSGLRDAISGALGGDGGGNNVPLLGYCPGGTYHPLNDPYACVPFPPETPEFEKQQRAAAAHKAAQDALRAQQRAQQQGCPPNTGLVKNAQGQCVCPPGYAANAQLKKCVLVNPALAAQANQAPDWLKYALLALGAVVVVKAVKK